ncbi:MAG: hypothetical protein U5R14_15770 [Gemmatimonadota bacterium]|nr:hypothetical protein [Gemmatimonadota bacterium]
MPIHHLRSRLVAARDALDGKLHPSRKARASTRLAELAPESVLFLCLGNVCRSPYGARVLAERLPGVRVDSAGFIGPDRAPPELAQDVARARGVDHADHCSKTLTPELLAATDVVFLFDRGNVRRLRRFGGMPPGRVFRLGDFDPVWTGKRAIIDPWGKPREEFDRTFGRIERCVEEVARALEG